MLKIAVYPFLTVPFARDAASFIEGKIEGRNRGITYGPGSMIEEVSKTLYTGVEVATGERDIKDIVKPALRAAGYVHGLPASQTEITAGYMWDLWAGEDVWRGPEWVRGPLPPILARRKPKDQRETGRGR